MEEIDITLDCNKLTKYKNLINKTGDLICPECKTHSIYVEETLYETINRERMIRKEIELDFETSMINVIVENIENVILQIDLIFEEYISKIEINSSNLLNMVHSDDLIDMRRTRFLIHRQKLESLLLETNGLNAKKCIEKINDIRIEIIEKIREKENELFELSKNFEFEKLSKEKFIKKIETIDYLFGKIDFEEDLKKKQQIQRQKCEKKINEELYDIIINSSLFIENMENCDEYLVFKNLRINISNYSRQKGIIENQKFECTKILTGHLDSVLCLKPVNENTVVSGSRDNGIMILNIDNPEYTQTFYGHTDSVNCLEIIDEKTLASGSSDKTIRIWNINNLQCIDILKTHSKKVNSLQLMNKNILASCSDDKTIRIWNLAIPRCIKTLNGHTDKVRSLEKINQSSLASCSDDKTIKIWQIDNSECIKTLNGHTSFVLCLQLIDENTLASGGADKTIRIWNLENSECIQTLNGHTGPVECLQSIKNNLASGSYDKTIRTWNINYSKSIRIFDNTAPVFCIQLINEDTLVSGSCDKFLRIARLYW